MLSIYRFVIKFDGEAIHLIAGLRFAAVSIQGILLCQALWVLLQKCNHTYL